MRVWQLLVRLRAARLRRDAVAIRLRAERLRRDKVVVRGGNE